MGFSVSTPVKRTARTLPSTPTPLPQRLSFPKYIYQTKSGLLIFRMKVPLDCRPLVNKRELQYSLKTRCIYSARKHIASILPFLNGIFEAIRTGVYNETTELTLQQFIMDGIRQVIRHTILGINGQRYLFILPSPPPIPKIQTQENTPDKARASHGLYRQPLMVMQEKSGRWMTLRFNEKTDKLEPDAVFRLEALTEY